ncbi:MAG: hypothetical protein NTW66_01445 [Candidatus Magasanikbacteria bacterium]|nr:hypothetical protein [Candidatus Magasanikbacteria bacterium]
MKISKTKNFVVELHHDRRGAVLLYATIFGFIAFSIVVAAVSGYAISEHRASVYKHGREMAFQIAEAGVNYYRWHLAHNKEDYRDGTASSGPYIHIYEDKNGTPIGHFSLNIIPPLIGSSVVTIESTGWLDAQPNSRRTIRARVGFPSLTDYAILTNSDIWIGDTEETHGKFHSNGGIRYDGIGDAPITSGVPTYNCKEHHGCGAGQDKPGIWGTGGPQSFWSFPVPVKSFDVVTIKLSDIKTGAQPENGGLYLTSSGKSGWRIRFRADGKIDVNKVNSVNCNNGKDIGSNKYVNYCIDIKTVGTTETRDMPTSSYIYVEDTVWVDGVVKGRATIGTATGKSIIINDNLTYTAKDGNHVLGLIAEQNILIPYNSPNNLEIDAAMLAQNGAAKRYFYPGNKRDNLLVYGSVISSGVWTWSWVSGGGEVVSGYTNTSMTYDVNLTYGPPPGFPVGSEYNLISWEEVD